MAWPARIAILCVCVLAFGGCSDSTRFRASGVARPARPQVPPELPPERAPTARTLYSMAQILMTQSRDTEGELVLRRCMHEYPRFAPAYNGLAELQMRQGRIHEAIEVLSLARKSCPRDPVLSNNLGMCLLLRREHEQALEQFTIAAGIVPESTKYRANMAIALGLLGRQEESGALLQQVLPPDKVQHNEEVLHKACEKAACRTTVSPPA